MLRLCSARIATTGTLLLIRLPHRVASWVDCNMYVFLVCNTCLTREDSELDSLEYRRLICDLVIMYKIVHNLIDVDRNSLITINSTSVTRNSFLKLYKPLCVSSVRSHFLCVRCINVWNYLSEEIKASASISAFKNSLVSYNLLSLLSVFKS